MKRALNQLTLVVDDFIVLGRTVVTSIVVVGLDVEVMTVINGFIVVGDQGFFRGKLLLYADLTPLLAAQPCLCLYSPFVQLPFFTMQHPFQLGSHETELQPDTLLLRKVSISIM